MAFAIEESVGESSFSSTSTLFLLLTHSFRSSLSQMLPKSSKTLYSRIPMVQVSFIITLRHCRKETDPIDCLPTMRFFISAGLLRELLQNSDDAGSTFQTFILDKRCFGTKTLYDPALAKHQGPALIAVNDSIFKAADWKAITQLYGKQILHL